MPLPTDKWPTFYFYDVRADKRVKVNEKDIKLKSGSTKGHGPGKYFQIVANKPGKLKYDLYKFVSEEKFLMLKDKMKSNKKSPRYCNQSPKAKCEKSRKCSWIKGKRGSRKGYCRKLSKKK